MNNRLRSECGLYFAEKLAGEHWYKLYDGEGNFICEATYWSSRDTTSRIGFQAGSGQHNPMFSYPRYPKWFKRRWVSCFDIKFDDIKQVAIDAGCEVLSLSKIGMTCHHNIGLRATPEQARNFDGELTRREIKWNGPPAKPGQWDIDCPDPEPTPEQ